MPQAQFIQDGDSIDYVPNTATPAGTVVVLESLIGVTKQDLAAGERGSMALTGVYEFNVENANYDVGVPMYWWAGEGIATFDNTGSRPLIGHVVEAVTGSSPTAKIRLAN